MECVGWEDGGFGDEMRRLGLDVVGYGKWDIKKWGVCEDRRAGFCGLGRFSLK